MRETNKPPHVHEHVRIVTGGTGSAHGAEQVILPRLVPPPSEPGTPQAPPVEDEGRWDSELFSGRRLSISMSALGLVGAVAVGLLAITWTVGYKAGEARQARLDGALLRTGDSQAVVDPMNTPDLVPPPAPGGAQGNSNTGAAAKPDADGAVGVDPRQRGYNYLIAATLPLKDAQAAARFLTVNGVGAAVVTPEGVDPVAGAANNRSLWLVIVSEGISPEEYRRSDDQRASLVNTVKQLGRRWRSEQRGSADFAQCYWKKFGK